VVWPRKF
jgi:hypothetical protein